MILLYFDSFISEGILVLVIVLVGFGFMLVLVGCMQMKVHIK